MVLVLGAADRAPQPLRELAFARDQLALDRKQLSVCKIKNSTAPVIQEVYEVYATVLYPPPTSRAFSQRRTRANLADRQRSLRQARRRRRVSSFLHAGSRVDADEAWRWNVSRSGARAGLSDSGSVEPSALLAVL
jgi:hypothetical protein